MRALIAAACLALAALAGCAAPHAAATGSFTEARVEARDSTTFRKQADGSWIEFAHSGLPRFRFVHERNEGEADIVLDETRNVRLKLDPLARTITEDGAQGWRPLYDISEAVRGVADAASAEPSRIWFVGGGAFVRDGEDWVEISAVDGFAKGARWRELGRDDKVIVLQDETNTITARIDLPARSVELTSPDAAKVVHSIRAAD